MTPEETLKEITAEAHHWTLKCAISDVFQRMHMEDDFAAFETYYGKIFDYQKDRLLRELEDSDPALAARIDDRDSTQLSGLL
jgi:hypothetical protein